MQDPWQQLSQAAFDKIITRIYKDNEPALDANPDKVSTRVFGLRMDLIKNIKKAIISLDDARDRLQNILVTASTMHATELSAVHKLLEMEKADSEEPETNEKPGKWIPACRRVQKSPPPIDVGEGNRRFIRVTPAFGVSAHCVPDFASVRGDGGLYYIEAANHFAVKIAGVLFHGNLGYIYSDTRNVEKIKDCRFAANCFKKGKCDYYHDPAIYEGSKDCRNYVAGRGKFGSRDTLDEDAEITSADELSRYRDQTMHSILCSILLARCGK